ncbi:unnamed protein product [Peniophora sp. CBMAI 1063]|nr:unnamed protein product [Peniophora sp. CBMAI 1063]
MAPTTRAQALSSTHPQKASNESPSTSPQVRKPPRCHTCNQLRKGHPLKGCPNQRQPVTDGAEDTSASDIRLADALSSLSLNTANESFSVTASAPLRVNKISNPAADGSINVWSSNKPEEASEPLDEPSPVVQKPPTPSTRSLTRPASISARARFFEDLGRIATSVPISVYVIPAAEAEQLQSSAEMAGFHATTVTAQKGTREEEVLLVLSNEDTAVRPVSENLEKVGAVAAKHIRGLGLAQVTAGAIVGAAAVFAGLAL